VNLLEEGQFLQMKDRVVIIYQRDHQVRWVWLNRDHSANPMPSWYGESIGHYEGDTLVATREAAIVLGADHFSQLRDVAVLAASKSPCGWTIPASSPCRGRERPNIDRPEAPQSVGRRSVRHAAHR
jgi:hypothetical protein